MRLNQAIVRTPGRSLIDGLTSQRLGAPDYALACRQHEAYIETLRRCGLNVTVLPAEESYPDSVFVEDTALLVPRAAIITRPGAKSRRGETKSIRIALERHFDDVAAIEAPGTVDAGDIMMVGSEFYIGLSGRTNPEGAAQMIELLLARGFICETVPLAESLHLKSSVAYLENNVLVIGGEMKGRPEFDRFDQIEVPAGDDYAANCLWINDRVLVAAGFPGVRDSIRARGYDVIELDVSEFRKVDGGLSCLSLRY